MGKKVDMKKSRNIAIVVLVLIILILILLKIFVGFSGPKLNKPESVVYDPLGQRFLISNVGNGSIMAMDDNGNISEFMSQSFTAPKGLVLKDTLLYVTDPTQIHVVDTQAASIIESYAIAGAIGLNDLAFTEENLLYITDTAGDCVYIYDPVTKAQEKIINPLLNKPNGIIYDAPRWQMFVVNQSKHSPIISINTKTKEVSIFMDTVYSNLDGIAIDDLGRIYFSSWSEEMIIEIPQEQNRFITDLKGIQSAADIYYHKPTNELIVPLLTKDRIQRIPLD